MNTQEARKFVARFADGKFTQAEHQEFLHWVSETSMDQLHSVADEFEAHYESWSQSAQPTAAWVHQLEQRLDKLEITEAPVVPIKRKIGIRHIIWTAAAVILVAVGAGTLYFILNDPAKQVKPVPNNTAQVSTQTIKPGGDNAVLTLSDGTSITLDGKDNNSVFKQGNSSVMVKGNALIYHVDRQSVQGEEIAYNTVETPRGGQYQLTLPDGTKTWLNAESSIRYPVEFNGKERKVEISGEVYFEVVTNPDQPFKALIVASKVDKQGNWARGRGEVEVVGTHFNIMAYENEPTIQTTLLKGSVKVAKGTSVRILKPGQQARIDNTPGEGVIKVLNVPDADKSVAWKNGFFYGPEAKTILQQIARWYDLTVVYEGTVPLVQFEGDLPRDMGIESTIELLKASGIPAELVKSERRILVKQ